MINMKVVAIIQARMGSTRLPGKVLQKIAGKTVLEHVVTRVKKSNEVDEIVIATTDKQEDDILVEEIRRLNTKYYRGSEDDVLSRYYYSAFENNADIIVRITSDCPLIDPFVTDKLISFFKKNTYDIVSNAGSDLGERTFPRGLDTEVFAFEQLRSAFEKSTEEYQREHVTPYIYEHSDKIYYYKNNEDFSKYRWTLDTPEDMELIKQIYEQLYKGYHDFYLEEIINLFKEQPDLYKINQHIEQKKIK
jgi:spore coat polysaccharide biosynthesis protein SpsF